MSPRAALWQSGAVNQGDPAASAARQELVDRLRDVARGDRAALAVVYDRTAAKLFGLCFRILGDRAEAEDALQEVYLSVWRKAASFDAGVASPITWLATMARNRAIDRLRAGRRLSEAAPIDAAREVADAAPDAPARIDAERQRTRLMACVDELEGRQAEAIRAAFFAGLTYARLAQRAGVPLGTMKSWVRRGLLRLRECLER